MLEEKRLRAQIIRKACWKQKAATFQWFCPYLRWVLPKKLIRELNNAVWKDCCHRKFQLLYYAFQTHLHWFLEILVQDFCSLSPLDEFSIFWLLLKEMIQFWLPKISWMEPENEVSWKGGSFSNSKQIMFKKTHTPFMDNFHDSAPLGPLPTHLALSQLGWRFPGRRDRDEQSIKVRAEH